MLELLGFEVHAFADPVEALDHRARHPLPFAVAVVDLTMPHLSGLEVLRELEARDPKLPVLLMSGYSKDDVPSEGDELRHDAFLTKPFTVRDFRA